MDEQIVVVHVSLLEFVVFGRTLYLVVGNGVVVAVEGAVVVEIEEGGFVGGVWGDYG